MKPKAYLFVGGPLHAQSLDVEVDPSVRARFDDGQPAAPDEDEDDAYPATFVDLKMAQTYTRRTVNHVEHSTGNTYQLRVFVWEGITDANTAQMYLGDAVAHRYFAEHGTVIEVADTVAAKRYGDLIIPG